MKQYVSEDSEKSIATIRRRMKEESKLNKFLTKGLSLVGLGGASVVWIGI